MNTAHGPVKGKGNIIIKWTSLLPVSSSSGPSCLKTVISADLQSATKLLRFVLK